MSFDAKFDRSSDAGFKKKKKKRVSSAYTFILAARVTRRTRKKKLERGKWSEKVISPTVQSRTDTRS